jgi:rod shape-determining protein MreC
MSIGGQSRTRLLLVILIVTSLFLVTLDLRGVKLLDSLKQGMHNVVSPFQRIANSALNPVKSFFSDISLLGRSGSQIDALEEENAALRLELLERQDADVALEQLKSILDLAGAGGYKIVNAKVISQGSYQSFAQTVTIGSGSNAGITQNMTVLSENGVAGIVKEVYPNSALIQLASDPAFRIGVRIVGSQQIGFLSGRGERSAVLQVLDNSTDINEGDVLMSRGSIANRPFVPGVPVGYITTVDNSAGTIAQSATVRYYTDFSKLSVLAVVVGGPKTNPGDALVPQKPRPIPTPTVTVFVTPTPSPNN